MTKAKPDTTDPEIWQRLNEIFAAAFEVDPVDWQPLLEELCVGDDELLREVESILKATSNAASKGFLEGAVFPEGAQLIAANEIAPGTEIGSYRIVREIGRGGMGAVYLAERADFRQQVALKIIKRGMDSDEIVRRFRQERQVLATLHHPNIARLLDGGTTREGTPFFAMEYLEGERITDVCDKQKLSIEQRLALFIKVCSAVSYAHQHLVIHRDIKPSNILVGLDGQPKLLDFGISKLVAPDTFDTTVEQTATGVRLMTPEYASPEQVRGEKVTTASDIYSLGVLLYELLSGHRPFRLRNRSTVDVLQIVSGEEPSAPSTVVLTTQVVESDGDGDKTLSPETIAASRQERPRGLHRRLSGDLDNITLKALRKEPSRRYESVEDMAQDIGRHLAGSPISARPPKVGYRIGKFVRRNRKSVATAAIFALLVAAIGASWTYFLWRPRDENKLTQTVAASTTIAVLPFKNLSSDKDDEFIGIGLTDALITRLGNVHALTVRPISSVAPFSGENDLSPRQLGEKLKVQVVLEGTVERTAEQLRVSLRLLRTQDGSTVWAQTYSKPSPIDPKLESEVSQKVVEALQIQLSSDERERLAVSETANPEASRLFLKARYFWSKRTPDDLKRAIGLFEQALQLDGSYAQAYAGIAGSYALLGGSEFSAISPGEAAGKARPAALKAIELDSNLAEAYAVLGTVQMNYDWNAVTAEQSFRRALEINPNYSTAHHWLAWCLITGSRFTEAEAEFRRARELDPTSLIIATESYAPPFFAGDYDAAIRMLREVLEIDKNFPGAHLSLWRTLHELKRYDEALAELDAIEPFIGHDAPMLLMARGRTLAMSGRPAEARRILTSLSERNRKGEYVSPLILAFITAELDDRDAAFHWLDAAFAERNDYLMYLPIAPEFNRLHNDLRFRDLVRRVDLES
jgi:eukaryotic-like serine/threonine-protein kinase